MPTPAPPDDAYGDILARLSDADARPCAVRVDAPDGELPAGVLGALREAWTALRSDVSTPGAYRQLSLLKDARTAVPWPFQDRLTFKLAVHPDDVRAAIQAAPVRRVLVLDKRIRSIQRTCSVARITQYLHEPALAEGRVTPAGTPQDLPIFVSYAGTWFYYDGNHRGMRAWLDGQSHMRVRFADLDAAAKAGGATRVQTIVFDKKTFTRAKAQAWCKTHDYKSGGVDETETSYRIRQRDPARFKPGSFKTIQMTKGVQAVIGKLK